MTKTMIDCYDEFIINDFYFQMKSYIMLFGNEIFDVDKILEKLLNFKS